FAPTTRQRHQQDVNIQRLRPVSNVINVMVESLFQARIATPAVNLCVAGNAGAHHVPDVISPLFLAKLSCEFGTFGPRSHEAHVSAQDVPELRQFIEAGTAQIKSDSRASRIAGYGPDRTEVSLGVLAHTPEFDDREASAIEPDAHLPIEHRAAVAHANG